METKLILITADLFTNQSEIAVIIDRIRQEKLENDLVIITGDSRKTDFPVNRQRKHGFSGENGATGHFYVTALFSELLNRAGVASSALTTSDIGLTLEAGDLDIEIDRIETEGIHDLFSRNCIPVICGDLPDSLDSNLVISGKCELLAVAVSSALGFPRCEFWRRSEGIYSSNFSEITGRKRIDRLSFDECMEMATLGAGDLPGKEVLQVAKKRGVEIFYMSPFEKEGTLIMSDAEKGSCNVKAVAYDTDTAKVALLGVPDRPGIAALVFSDLAEQDISVEMIIQSVMRGQINDIAFLVKKSDIEKTISVCRGLAKETGAQGVTFDTEIARVSVVGAGISKKTHIPARVFSTLASHDINIEMIASTSISVVCVVSGSSVEEAVRALHEEFVE